MSDKLAPSERHAYVHQGRTIYEWDQTLSDLNVYVQLPTGVRAKQLFVDISSSHLRVGIKPNPPYLDVRRAAQHLFQQFARCLLTLCSGCVARFCGAHQAWRLLLDCWCAPSVRRGHASQCTSIALQRRDCASTAFRQAAGAQTMAC